MSNGDPNAYSHFSVIGPEVDGDHVFFVFIFIFYFSTSRYILRRHLASGCWQCDTRVLFRFAQRVDGLEA